MIFTRQFMGGLAGFALAAAVNLSALMAAQAETPAQPAPGAPPISAGAKAAACNITPDQVRLGFRLPRVARRLAAGKPVKIIALGSSSTYGAGASTSAAAYPNRLAEE